jgi:hypothetical protein
VWRLSERRRESRPARPAARSVVAEGEAFSLATGFTALYIRDLAVLDGQDLKPLDPSAAFVRPCRRADDLVADDLELRLDDGWRRPLLDLRLENLTGLVRAASGWCLLPPEVTV